MFKTASSRLLVGHRQVVGARNLVRRLIPVDAGVPLPERRERRLVFSARRSGLRPSDLTALKSSVYVSLLRPRGGSGRNWVLLTRTNMIGECQPLRAHRRRRRYGPPLADRGATHERWVARAEAVGGAPGEHSLRDLDSPGDAALDARRAHVLSSARVLVARALVAEHCERRLIARVQRRLSGTGRGRPAPCTRQR